MLPTVSHNRNLPRWQWILLLLAVAVGSACSAFGPTVIYERPSMFGQLVVTDDGDDLRSLRFGRNGITQSTIKVGDPDHLQFGYTRLVLTAFVLAPAPRRILVVGLGGASLPVFLHRHYPDALIDVVEIDPEVVSAARLHFGFRDDARLRAHVDDGRAFIERAPAAHYDVIILDAFGSAEVPAHLTTQEFLEAVRRALAPDGVVVSNIWSRLYNAKYDAMLRTYLQVFEQMHLLEARGDVNRIVLALPRAQAIAPAQFAARARQLSLAKGYRFNLGTLFDASLEPTPVKQADVPVLRDARVTR